MIAAQSSSPRPEISQVENGSFNLGEQASIAILGRGFTPSTKVFIGPYLTQANFISEGQLELPANSLSLLPLQIGLHHIRVANQELTDEMYGAIIMADELSDVQYSLSDDQATLEGSFRATITASKAVFLPGTKVILRALDGRDIHSDESTNIDLKDDVEDLSTFSFVVPSVTQPGIYQIILDVDGRETVIDRFSYTQENGLRIDLPNQPPHLLGGGVSRENQLVVGVRQGERANNNNRFLMESGVEIYDIGIWDNPVRLSQLTTTSPVNGLDVKGNLLAIAADASGLLLADLSNAARPLVIKEQAVAGHRATDAAISASDNTLAVSFVDDLGTGFLRFIDLYTQDLSPPLGLSTIAFSEGDIAGEPLDVQWQEDKLLVLLRQQGQLVLVQFNDPSNPSDRYVQTIDRGENASDHAAFYVYFDQVLVSTGEELLTLRADENNVYQTVYWSSTDLPSAAIIGNEHSAFISTVGGVENLSSQPFALTTVERKNAVLAANEPLTLRFNNYINTNEDALSALVNIRNQSGELIDASHYTLEGINTVSGGLIEVRFGDSAPSSQSLLVQLTEQPADLQGRNLPREINYEIYRSANELVAINTVQSLSTNGSNFFRGDGTESAQISGTGFGDSADNLLVAVGDYVLSVSEILSVNDTEIQFKVPNFFSPSEALSLPVSVARGETEASLLAAMTIIPTVRLEEMDVVQGPPEGGNVVNLFGRGFSSQLEVRFGDQRAAIDRVISANQVRVIVPANNFGYQQVTVTHPLFADDNSSGLNYFYSSAPAGSVNVADDKPAPLSALHLGDQILYSVTGGTYDIYDERTGALGKRLSSSVARLFVADLSDPTNPQIIEKELTDGVAPYFIDVDGGIEPSGFELITGEDNRLYVAGGQSLFVFDTTLAADPILLERITLEGRARDIAVENGIIYLSTSLGIEILKENDEGLLQRIGQVDRVKLGGTTDRLHLDGRSLWATMKNSRRVVAIELLSGQYEPVVSFSTRDIDGNRFRPENVLVSGDRIFVSTGDRATIELYQLGTDSAQAVAQLNLSYLVRNGELYAGQMKLIGQSLYVAGGQGDLQVFNVGAWLEGNFTTQVELANYFSALGDVTAFATDADAIYAVSTFAYLNDEAKENPFADPRSVSAIGGRVNTMIDTRLNVLTQHPQPEATLAKGETITLQFNQHLALADLKANAASYIGLSLNGAELATTVQTNTTRAGTQLTIKPVQPLQAGQRYRVRISAALKDNRGQTLNENLSYRFTAADEFRPTFESLSPNNASWRGGEVLTLTGENIDATTVIQLGEQTIPASAIVSSLPGRVQFIAPSLTDSPSDNTLVGIKLSNASLSTVRPAAYRYLADPEIESIGLFSSETKTLDTNVQRFELNSSQRIAIRGRGFNRLTQVSVNGSSPANLRVESDDLISFSLPENTLGRLVVTVSNGGEADTVENNTVLMDLSAYERVSNVSLIARNNDFLVLANDRNWQYTSTAQSDQPLLLAKGSAPGAIKAVDLGERYLSFIYEQSNRDKVVIYDLINIYEPKVVNRFDNTNAYDLDSVTVVNNAVYIRSGERLLKGNVFGQEFSVDTLDKLLDIEISAAGIYALYEARIDSLNPVDLSTKQSYLHSIVSPRTLQYTDQLLLLSSANDVELVSAVKLDAGENPFIARQQIASKTLRLNGELLMVEPTDDDQSINIYDLNQANSELEFSFLSSIQLPSATSLQSAEFETDLLEWAVGSKYFNARIPFNNITAIEPLLIRDAFTSLQIRTAGASSNWESVDLNVSSSAQQRLPGEVSFVGSELLFTNLGGSFEEGTRYSIELDGEPKNNLRVAPTRFDLPRSVATQAVFGIEPFVLDSLSPRNVITDRETEFTIRGARLDAIDEVQVGSIIIDSDRLTVNSEGTQLSFIATFDQAEIQTLAVYDNDALASDFLPAAVLVAEAITVETVSTDNARGESLLSDSGNNTITITGRGLSGEISAHLVPVAQGVEASADNRIDYRFSQGNIVVDATPEVVAGRDYQLILIRKLTNETVAVDPSFYLQGTDDTRPTTVGKTELFSYTSDFFLSFDEAISAQNLVVEQRLRDYSASAPIDVTAQFVIANSSDKSIRVSLAAGQQLQSNSTYAFTISGIADSAGNAPIISESGLLTQDDGSIAFNFVTRDTLPPRNLQVVRINDDGSKTAVTPATLLTKGRDYTFEVSAEDNYDDLTKLRFSYRVSTEFDAATSSRSNFDEYRQVNALMERGFSYYEFKDVEVADRANNKSRASFRSSLRDPQITIESFSTNPQEPEESLRADLLFTLGGDIDMLNSAEMSVDRINRNIPQNVFKPSARANGLVSASFLHPKIRDIVTQGNPLTEQLLTANLAVSFGEGYNAQFSQSYTLFLDRTPPTISIVSPDEGSFVPVDERTDVIVKAFDKYGIDYLEFREDNGAWQRFDDVNRYSFTPTEVNIDSGVLIEARAVDPNGNVSPEAAIRLFPYDPEAGAPELEIIAPFDGDSFNEAQPVAVEIQMRNLDDAEIYLDLGGVEDPSQTPLTITRSENSSRVSTTVTMPQIDSDSVVILRVQKGAIRSYRFLNIVNDEGIEEEPAIKLLPESLALTGSTLIVQGTEPQGMKDFSEDSLVEVRDPVAAQPVSIPMLQRYESTVSTNGDTASVTGVLKDLSGNSKEVVSEITKLRYLDSDTSAFDVVGLNASDELLAIVAGPVAEQNTALREQAIFAINRAEGGYSLTYSDGSVIASKAEGSLTQVVYTGEFLIYEAILGAKRKHYARRFAQGVLLQEFEFNLPGEVIGAAANRIWTQSGQSIGASILTDDNGVQSVPGYYESGRIVSASIDGLSLWLLTDSGISMLDVAASADELKVERQQFFALADQDGFVVNGDFVTTWSSDLIRRHELSPTGLVQDVAIPAEQLGLIQQAQYDGEILWILQRTQRGASWFGYLNNELVGVFAQAHPALGFLSDSVIYASEGPSGLGVMQRARITQPSAGDATLVEVSNTGFGIEVEVRDTENFRGARRASFSNESGDRVAASIIARTEHSNIYFVPRSELTSANLLNVQILGANSQAEQSITISPSASADLQTLAPLSLVLSEESEAALIAELAPSAIVQSLVASSAGVDHTLARLNSTRAFIWLAQNTQSLELRADGVLKETLTFATMPNISEGIQVNILSPITNAEYQEGEELVVEYAVRDDQQRPLQYVLIELEDFNGNTLTGNRLAAASGSAALSLPTVAISDTFFVRVTAVFGEQHMLQSRKRGIRITPRQRLPEPEFIGINSVVSVGTDITITLASVNSDLQQTIQVRDGQGEIIAAGGSELSFTVPSDAGALAVQATVTDSSGNTRTSTRNIRVRQAITVQQTLGYEFDQVLVSVEGAYLAKGRQLTDEQGNVLAILETAITALEYYDDRLIAALDDGRLVILSPDENYAVVGTYYLHAPATTLKNFGSSLYVNVDGQLMAFDIQGNITEAAGINFGQSADLDEQLLLDFESVENQLIALYQNALAVFTTDASGSLQLVNRIDLADALSLLVTRNNVLVATESGELLRLSLNDLDRNAMRRVVSNVQAEKLIQLGDYLIALNGSQGSASIIDIASPSYPLNLGTVALPSIFDAAKSSKIGDAIHTGDSVEIAIDFGESAITPIFESSSARGTATDVTFSGGRAVAALAGYGARLYSAIDGIFESKNYPEQGYNTPSEKVVADENYAYLAQQTRRRLVRVDTESLALESRAAEQVIFSNIGLEALTLTQSRIIASDGNTLFVAEKSDSSKVSEFSLPAGELITELVAAGDTVYAATINRSLYQITLGDYPLSALDSSYEAIINGSSSAIEHLSVSGDYLYFVSGEDLHQLKLDNLNDRVIELTGGEIQAVHASGGHIFVAQRSASSSVISTVEPENFTLATPNLLTLAGQVRAISQSFGRLAVARAGLGVSIYELGSTLQTANAEWLSPALNATVQQGDLLNFALNDTDQISAVDYLVNNKRVASATRWPFNAQALVPPYLRNGQSFTLTARALTAQGQIAESAPRNVLLQGEDLPGNTFDVVMTSPAAGETTYLPKPLELRAEIRNSLQPVYQVEYYEADSIDGPYRNIGKHYGPVFVIYRDYSLADSGKFLKLRAVDIYGNITESAPREIIRAEDNSQPQISIASIEGPTVTPLQIVGRHDYSFNATVADGQSGIENAVLRRNGAIVSAVFTDGELSYTDRNSVEGETVTYEIISRDRAGNVNVASRDYLIVEDTAPQITRFNAPSTIIERSAFTTDFRASDQVEIVRSEISWNGILRESLFSGRNVSKNYTLRDARADRLAGALSEDLVLRVFDDLGQMSEQSLVLTVTQDLPPVASAMRITHPASAFYGRQVSVNVSDLRLANDGVDAVTLELLSSVNDATTVIQTRTTASSSASLRFSIPQSDLPNDEFIFSIRITDHLGQADVSAPQTIVLTQVPNNIRFVKSPGNSDSNPVSIAAGDLARYEVQVVDSAARRVPNQPVVWSLESVSSGARIDAGTSQTNAEGFAELNLNTALSQGSYNLSARLSNVNINPALLRVQVRAGETRTLDIQHIAALEAGSQTTIAVVAKDIANNLVINDSSTSLSINAPAGFNFGLGAGAITTDASGEETITLALSQGVATVGVSAAELAGDYQLIPATDSASVTVRYASAPNASFSNALMIPVSVYPADPSRVEIVSTNRTNHPFGDESILEQGETVDLDISVYDRFSNLVSRSYNESTLVNSSLQIAIAVDGQAEFESTGLDQASLIAESGIASAKVSNDQAETVVISIDNIDGQTGIAGELELTFAKRKPAIEVAVVQKAINSKRSVLDFIFTELVAIDPDDTNAPLIIASENVEREGLFDIETITNTEDKNVSKVSFFAEEDYLAGECLDILSDPSSLRGIDQNDPLLSQTIELCLPKLAFNVPEETYLFAGESLVITAEVADSLTSSVDAFEVTTQRVIETDPQSFEQETVLSFANASFNLNAPNFADKDGELWQLDLAAAISGQTEPEEALNIVQLRILLSDGDYDQDGLPNALEKSLGLDPTNEDSDGNGVADGSEDLDADGLTNSEEVNAGTDLDDADTDNDGLSDADEIYIHASDPLVVDSDGDGLSDFVEVISDSLPNNASDSFIDPAFITQVSAMPASISLTFKDDLDPVQLMMSGRFEANGRSEIINLSNFIEFFSFTSEDNAVTDVDLNGSISFNGIGQTTIRALMIESSEIIEAVIPVELGDGNRSVSQLRNDRDQDGYDDDVEVVAGSDPDNSGSSPADGQLLWSLPVEGYLPNFVINEENELFLSGQTADIVDLSGQVVARDVLPLDDGAPATGLRTWGRFAAYSTALSTVLVDTDSGEELYRTSAPDYAEDYLFDTNGGFIILQQEVAVFGSRNLVLRRFDLEDRSFDWTTNITASLLYYYGSAYESTGTSLDGRLAIIEDQIHLATSIDLTCSGDGDNGGYGDDGYGDDGYGNDGYGDDGYGDSGSSCSGGGYGDDGYGNDGYGDSGSSEASTRTNFMLVELEYGNLDDYVIFKTNEACVSLVPFNEYESVCSNRAYTPYENEIVEGYIFGYGRSLPSYNFVHNSGREIYASSLEVQAISSSGEIYSAYGYGDLSIAETAGVLRIDSDRSESYSRNFGVAIELDRSISSDPNSASDLSLPPSTANMELFLTNTNFMYSVNENGIWKIDLESEARIGTTPIVPFENGTSVVQATMSAQGVLYVIVKNADQHTLKAYSTASQGYALGGAWPMRDANPQNNRVQPETDLDSDGDGFSDAIELEGGSSIYDPDDIKLDPDRFAIESLTVLPREVEIDLDNPGQNIELSLNARLRDTEDYGTYDIDLIDLVEDIENPLYTVNILDESVAELSGDATFQARSVGETSFTVEYKSSGSVSTLIEHPILVYSITSDADQDGYLDWVEAKAGSQINDPNSIPGNNIVMREGVQNTIGVSVIDDAGNIYIYEGSTVKKLSPYGLVVREIVLPNFRPYDEMLLSHGKLVMGTSSVLTIIDLETGDVEAELSTSFQSAYAISDEGLIYYIGLDYFLSSFDLKRNEVLSTSYQLSPRSSQSAFAVTQSKLFLLRNGQVFQSQISEQQVLGPLELVVELPNQGNPTSSSSTLAVDSLGYLVALHKGRLFRINPSRSQNTAIVSASDTSYHLDTSGLVLDGDDNAYLYDSVNGDIGVVAIKPSGEILWQNYFGRNLGNLGFSKRVPVIADNQSLYAFSPGERRIVEFELDTGRITNQDSVQNLGFIEKLQSMTMGRDGQFILTYETRAFYYTRKHELAVVTSSKKDLDPYSAWPMRAGGHANTFRAIPVELRDDDADGLPRNWENRFGLNDYDANDALNDQDGDGLENIDEYKNQTDPALFDTDDDGLSDSQEVNEYGTSPISPDTDGDGLSDSEELEIETDPLSDDTDGDGFNDFVEYAQADTDPKDSNSSPPLISYLSLDFESDNLPSGVTVGNGNFSVLTDNMKGFSDSRGVELSHMNQLNMKGYYTSQTFEFRANVVPNCTYLVVYVDNEVIWEYRHYLREQWKTFTLEIQKGQHEISILSADTQNAECENSLVYIDDIKIYNPASAAELDVFSDLDEDGLLNGEELTIGTSPFHKDTDADLIADSEEAFFGTDPTVYDSDFDDLGDGEESLVIGTDPLNLDTDRDGYNDGDEVLHALTDPLDVNSAPTEAETIIVSFDNDLLPPGVTILSASSNTPTYTNEGFNGTRALQLDNSVKIQGPFGYGTTVQFDAKISSACADVLLQTNIRVAGTIFGSDSDEWQRLEADLYYGGEFIEIVRSDVDSLPFGGFWPPELDFGIPDFSCGLDAVLIDNIKISRSRY